MTTKKKVVSVAKKTTLEDKLDAIRWQAFIKASGLPYEQLSEEWLSVFDAQSRPETASLELVKLVDLAIQADIAKENLK